MAAISKEKVICTDVCVPAGGGCGFATVGVGALFTGAIGVWVVSGMVSGVVSIVVVWVGNWLVSEKISCGCPWLIAWSANWGDGSTSPHVISVTAKVRWGEVEASPQFAVEAISQGQPQEIFSDANQFPT